MALATISFDIADMLEVDFDPRRTKLWVTSNITDDTLVDTTGNKIYLGTGNITIAADGTGTFTTPIPAANYNPETWQISVHVDYPDRNSARGRGGATFGPFTISASANLADLIEEQAIPATYVSQVTELLDTYVDSASAAATTAAAAAVSAAASAAITSSATSSLIVVAGGSVNLDNTKPDGYLTGYRVTSTTAIEGATFTPGTYVFERDSDVPSGWTYRTLETPTPVAGDGEDSTAPTAPTLTVDNTASDQLVATFTGGTDAVGITQRRTRINGGAWTVGTSPRTFTGLTPETSYTIDAQNGDAAGNWSTSDTWTGSTAAFVLGYEDEVLADSPTYLWMMNDAPGDTTPTNLGSGPQTLTLSGGATMDGAAIGTLAKSLALDATGLGNLPTNFMSGVSQYTVEAVVCVTTNGSADMVLYTATDWSGKLYLETWSGGNLTPKFWPSQEAEVFAAPAANRYDQAMHLCVVYDGAQARIYINGTQVASQAKTGNVYTNAGDVDFFSAFKGRVAGLAMYAGTSLSAGRVLAHAQAAGVA